MATEYVDGPSLTELIEAGGPLPPAKQLALAVGLAEGLKSIHDEDVVHRDLKPSQRALRRRPARRSSTSASPPRRTRRPITRSGLMVGSPGLAEPRADHHRPRDRRVRHLRAGAASSPTPPAASSRSGPAPRRRCSTGC